MKSNSFQFGVVFFLGGGDTRYTENFLKWKSFTVAVVPIKCMGKTTFQNVTRAIWARGFQFRGPFLTKICRIVRPIIDTVVDQLCMFFLHRVDIWTWSISILNSYENLYHVSYPAYSYHKLYHFASPLLRNCHTTRQNSGVPTLIDSHASWELAVTRDLS